MTLEHIRIEFRCAEGALRRTLGVVEARGFSVRSMQMGSDGDAGVMTLALAPLDSTRKVERLLRQLERLQDVQATIHLSNATPVAEVIHAARA
ncbi:ACT domain-containing protein [Citromicrobium bathyomarinum]|uniref:ACT domain-containing protein n=1 Tax=Citromicrobium bathyomarinum TaxID=72174 RepID=UPI00315A35DA|tara:strand:+ start:463 stop:741 length:279 start_codon:yes stop_codon:yes gene_type:complete